MTTIGILSKSVLGFIWSRLVVTGVHWAWTHKIKSFFVASIVNVFIGIAAAFWPPVYFASAIAFFIASCEASLFFGLLTFLTWWDENVDKRHDLGGFPFVAFLMTAVLVYIAYLKYADAVASLHAIGW